VESRSCQHNLLRDAAAHRRVAAAQSHVLHAPCTAVGASGRSQRPAAGRARAACPRAWRPGGSDAV